MKTALLLLALVAVGFAVSCSKSRETKSHSEVQESVVRVSGESLFGKETRHLEPHLGFYSGLVRISKGEAPYKLTCKLEAWSKGKKKAHLASITEEVKGECEVSVSVKPPVCRDNRTLYDVTVVIHQGDESTTLRTQIDSVLLGLGNQAIENPRAKTIKSQLLNGRDQATVWALVSSAKNQAQKDSLFESLESAEAAVVLHLSR